VKFNRFFTIFPLILVSASTVAFQLPEVFSLDGNKAFVSAQPDTNHSFKYSFPNIELLDQHNEIVQLDELLNKDSNVVFAFFFTHCVSVCTTVTLSLKSIEKDLPQNTRIALISIDPKTDTPDILANYAQRHRISGDHWQLLTGEYDDIVDLQKHFEAYRGNKMNHVTSLFIKKSGSEVVTEIKNNFARIPELLLQAASLTKG
jgi:cytochrome oxidase Cu insertion factor (SCO1/SenC/PrrC family)